MSSTKKLVFAECGNATMIISIIIFAIGAWLGIAGSNINNENLKVIGLIICSLSAIILSVVEEKNTLDVWVFAGATVVVALLCC